MQRDIKGIIIIVINIKTGSCSKWNICKTNLQLLFIWQLKRFLFNLLKLILFYRNRRIKTSLLNTSTPANLSWSWRRLQHVFSVTILRPSRRLQDEKLLRWKRLQDTLKKCLEYVITHVLKTSWRHVLKMSWRHVFKTSWRHYGTNIILAGDICIWQI